MSKYNPLEFERWRKMMLGGALVLLLVSILRAAGIIDGGPLYAIGLVAGYLLLAFGFADSFRARRAKQQQQQGQGSASDGTEDHAPPT